MKLSLSAIREAAAKRALYRRTRDEIASLSQAEAADIGIFRGDAARIAYEAVYGARA